MSRRRGLLTTEASEWQRKAELAISKDRDDLARAALVERTKVAEQAQVLDDELAVLDETLAKLNDDIYALQEKIKDAKNRQNAIILRGKAAQTRLGVRRQLNDHSIDDAMNRFEHYERKMDDVEGQIESYDMGQRTLASEIDELDRDDAVDEELARLKAQVKNGDDADQAKG